MAGGVVAAESSRPGPRAPPRPPSPGDCGPGGQGAGGPGAVGDYRSPARFNSSPVNGGPVNAGFNGPTTAAASTDGLNST